MRIDKQEHRRKQRTNRLPASQKRHDHFTDVKISDTVRFYVFERTACS